MDVWTSRETSSRRGLYANTPGTLATGSLQHLLCAPDRQKQEARLLPGEDCLMYMLGWVVVYPTARLLGIFRGQWLNVTP